MRQDVKTLLDKFRLQGMDIDLKGDNLEVFYDNPDLPESTLEDLKVNKQEIVDYLKAIKQGRGAVEMIPSFPIQADYPLSSSQRRIWILCQFEGGSTAYNMPGVFLLEGKIEARFLKEAFLALIERHEILRTVFRVDERDRVRQVILSLEDLCPIVEFLDFRKKELDDPEVRAVIQSDADHIFNLSTGPLVKLRLIQIDEEKYVLTFLMHHIISDGWSSGLVMKELFDSYKALSKGNYLEQPSLRIQYRDYSVWQEKQLKDGILNVHKTYWINRFLRNVVNLNLLPDKARPAIRTYSGDVVKGRIEKDLSRDFQKLLKDQGCTLFMGLTALVKLLLFKYTHQTDLTLGSPIAGRDNADLENQAGCYINTLALRTQFTPESGFCDLLREVKKITIEAFEHQSYPFDELVEQLNLSKDMSRNPLFDIMIILHNVDASNSGTQTDAMDDLKIQALEEESMVVSKFDMTYHFAIEGNDIALAVEYNSDIYRKSTVNRMIGHLTTLLKSIISNPSLNLLAIDYLEASEIASIIAKASSPVHEYDESKTCIQLFEEQVLVNPGKLALEIETKAYTYKDLDDRSNWLAVYIKEERGVNKGDLVVLQQERSEWLVIAILAVLKAGAAFVPVDPLISPDRLEIVIEDAKSPLIFDQKELDLFLAVKPQLSKPQPGWYPHPEDLAYVIYTSGSTGKPKGVMVEHQNLMSFVQNLPSVFSFQRDEKILFSTHYTFDISILEIIGSLSCGMTMIMTTSDDPGEIIQLVSESNADILQVTPSRLAQLMVIDGGKEALSGLNKLLIGGEAMKRNQYQFLKSLKGTEVFNCYGPTETTIWSTVLSLHGSESLTIGKALLNETVYLLDVNLQVVPDGCVGEICIGGEGVSRGYLNRSALTTDRFVNISFNPNEKIYRTGDLGRRLMDGTIEFIGRNDDQVKILGHRIEPQEIENALLEYPEMISCAVVVKEMEGDNRLFAFVVMKEDVSVAEIRSFLATKLPEYMIPGYYEKMNVLPLLQSGKVDRKSLSLLAPGFLLAPTGYEEPRTTLEYELADVWKSVLRVKQIGVKDNFFDLGGDSLRAILLLNRIKRTYEVSIHLKDFFETPTVEALSSEVDKIRWLKKDVDMENELII